MMASSHAQAYCILYTVYRRIKLKCYLYNIVYDTNRRSLKMNWLSQGEIGFKIRHREIR